MFLINARSTILNIMCNHLNYEHSQHKFVWKKILEYIWTVFSTTRCSILHPARRYPWIHPIHFLACHSATSISVDGFLYFEKVLRVQLSIALSPFSDICLFDWACPPSVPFLICAWGKFHNQAGLASGEFFGGIKQVDVLFLDYSLSASCPFLSF